MKATSSISSAGTDKAFGLGAASSATGASAGSGEGFLAMLDGMIQTMNAGQSSGQAASNGAHDQSQQAQSDAAMPEADVLDNADIVQGETLPSDTVSIQADQTDSASAVALPSLTNLENAITLTPAVASASVQVPTAKPVAASDSALAVLAVQAGVVVPVAAPAPSNEVALQPASASPAPVVASQSASAAVAAVLQPASVSPAAVVFTAAPVSALPATASNTTVSAVATSVSSDGASAAQSQLAVTLSANAAPLPVAGNTSNSIGADQAGSDASAQIVAQPVVADNAQPAVIDVAVPKQTISITALSAKAASTQADQDNADSQQSAILSALFAQAPLQTIQTVAPADALASKAASPVSGAPGAATPSVLGVGIPPTLLPPAFAGNGNHSADAQAGATSVEAQSADSSAQSITIHATQAPAAFGIAGNVASVSVTTDDADVPDAAASTPEQISGDAAKAEAIASLFIGPQAKSAKAASSDATTDAPTAAATTGTPGLTLVHQSAPAVAATATTANATAASASAYTSPAAQVSVVISRAVSAGSHSMTVALNPIELGKVEVKLDFAKDGSVQASVTAERPETLSLLKNDHSTLTQALHNAGLTTTSNSLSFNLRDGGQSQQQQGFGSASSYRGRVDVSTAADDTISTTSPTVQYAVVSDNGRLNVIV